MISRILKARLPMGRTNAMNKWPTCRNALIELKRAKSKVDSYIIDS